MGWDIPAWRAFCFGGVGSVDMDSSDFRSKGIMHEAYLMTKLPLHCKTRSCGKVQLITNRVYSSINSAM
jgi:hypothetical protein